MADDGTVQITLKDVYQQQQSLEKSLGDALVALNLTLVSIKSHLDLLDNRNTSADQLHIEHGARLTRVESVLQAAQPEATHRDHELRLRGLERFKYALMGALILVNGLAVFIEYLLTHHL